MKVQLVCDKAHRETLEKHLIDKGMEIVESSNYVFLDKTYAQKKYVFARDEDKNIILLEYDKILYFESFDKITEAVTADRRLLVKEKLYQLEEQLILMDFIRVNKSVLVNMLQVEQIVPWIGSKFILDMKNGDQVDVTRTYFPEFKRKLGI